MEHIQKKHKSKSVKPAHVKNHLWVFVNALVVNPRFDSQTKVNLTSTKSTFKSKWEPGEAFLKKVVGSEIVESVMSFLAAKDSKDLKKTDAKGKSQGRLSGIAKLEDANDAGTKKGADCTLILTEGDSAKALAMAGLAVVGREKFGVFPLRGKPLNVRDATAAMITKNAEITAIKQIVGLKNGVKYEDASKLRYGHVMIMADQDHDGSHIKGLIINLFACFWPELMKLPGFLTEFITPIVKVSKRAESLSFYTLLEYEAWKALALKGWKIKYYKGLGTSTNAEAKEYFSDIDRHKIDFRYDGVADIEAIALAFAKTTAKGGRGTSKAKTTAKGGRGTSKAHGEAKGEAKGAVKGEVKGVVKGAAKGAVKGAVKDAAKGAVNGAAKGAANGAVKGEANGVVKGEIQGVVKGEVKGEANGVVKGEAQALDGKDGDVGKGEAKEGKGLAKTKGAADVRKDWIADYEPGTYLDQDVDAISYSDFVNKELILFSIESNTRAIPSIMDGLKPGQRKILYACFKRNLHTEVKVAQLSGYVSEHAAYHHGEASLSGTIIKMAQTYVGSNNVNLLYPSGQFGTRAEQGDDAASPRYTFTNLCPVTRLLLKEVDDNIVRYLEDDGQMVEPDYYLPVIPLVLINGTSGIGTGWSTDIPNFNPREIVANLRRLQRGEASEEMHPWYKAYKGTIALEGKTGTNKYTVRGLIEKTGPTTLRITELPIHKGTTAYRTKVLEEHLREGRITGFKEHHSDLHVDFSVETTAEHMATFEQGVGGLEKHFGLVGSCSVNNMVLFDQRGKLRRYNSAAHILTEWYKLRLPYYETRKDWMVGKLDAELRRISNKLRFILAVLSDELKIRNVKKQGEPPPLLSLPLSPYSLAARLLPYVRPLP